MKAIVQRRAHGVVVDVSQCSSEVYAALRTLADRDDGPAALGFSAGVAGVPDLVQSVCADLRRRGVTVEVHHRGVTE